MTPADVFAETLREHPEEVALGYLWALRGGDWRAGDALATRVLGRPTERVETTETTELGRLTNLTEEQLLTLRAELDGEGVVAPLRLAGDTAPASSPGPHPTPGFHFAPGIRTPRVARSTATASCLCWGVASVVLRWAPPADC